MNSVIFPREVKIFSKNEIFLAEKIIKPEKNHVFSSYSFRCTWRKIYLLLENFPARKKGKDMIFNFQMSHMINCQIEKFFYLTAIMYDIRLYEWK